MNSETLVFENLAANHLLPPRQNAQAYAIFENKSGVGQKQQQ